MRSPLRALVTVAFTGSVALLLAVAAPRGDSDAVRAPDAADTGDLASAEAAEPLSPVEEPAPTEPVWVDHEISPGQVLGKILPRYGLPVDEVLAAARPHFDLRKMQAGKVLRIRTPPGATEADCVEYALSEDRTLVLERGPEGWTGRVDAVEYTREQTLREFTVRSTLWGAAVEAGLRPADIASLAEVYRWDIDFNTEIRAGAHARMVVDQLYVDGQPARLGAPLAVRLTNGGKEYVAIQWTGGDGRTRYYDVTGKARQRPFLRSPLKFSRVTSGFNPRGRFHPVLKRSRPHNGVDFGAPTGTPVYAVGDAVVSFAGTSGGHGRFVKLDHEGPYESSYSHLSRIAVRKGQKIRQGDLIGYVGSTGLATGPHLHYQFWVNGKYANPLTVPLPKGGESVPEAERKAFEAHRDALLAQLDTDAVDEIAVADAEGL